MRALRVAQGQLNVIVGDFRENMRRILECVEEAKSVAADIIIFPEHALCGYPPEDLLLRPRFLKDNLRALEVLAARCHGITVLVGFPDSKEGRVYNAAAIIADGAVVGIYHKIELPNYGVFDEKRYFYPGSSCLIFMIEDIRCTVTLCEDIWVPNSLAEQYAAKNKVQITFNLSASPFHIGKFTYRLEHIVARFAQATGSTVFFTNLVGGQDDLVFDGGSMVVDPSGHLIAAARRFQEDLLVTDVTIPQPREESEKRGMDKAVPVLRRAILRQRPKLNPPLPLRHWETVEEVYHALVLGTQDYVRKNGFSDVVLGLSGGIDSALTAVIAADAVGSDRVVGVTMPSRYTSLETLTDAELLAHNLGIRFMKIPIPSILDAYLDALKDSFGNDPPGVETENLQARIRGNILMALSNKFGWLVLSTGNKSETAVGYCTLYGDMAGGFAVVKDVPKTLVYQLAAFVNKRAGRDIIPQSTISRPPTAELRPNQKDEDSLPPYPILDPILKFYVEENKAPHEIVGFGFDPDLVRQVATMVDRNEYKRRQAPPGVKITLRAFGRDRRLPITNRYLGGEMDDSGWNL